MIDFLSFSFVYLLVHFSLCGKDGWRSFVSWRGLFVFCLSLVVYYAVLMLCRNLF